MARGERPPLALQMVFIGKHIGHLLERRLAAHGLNRTQAMVLITLRHHPGLKALDLCAPARVEPANVTRTVQSLERAGLLERRPHPTDGRASLFYPTAAGREMAVELTADVDRLSADLVARMSTEEVQQLERVLGAVRRSVGIQLSGAGGHPPLANWHTPPAGGETAEGGARPEEESHKTEEENAVPGPAGEEQAPDRRKLRVTI